MLRVDAVVGTRPEAIKMAPVIRALRRAPDVACRLILSRQHRHLVGPVLALFGLSADAELDVEHGGGCLDRLGEAIEAGLRPLLTGHRPDVLLVHGDTATAYAGARSAAARGIPVAHVEAGLRSGNPDSPWPEEMHRVAIARLASAHYAPTVGARDALVGEGVPDHAIVVTGNSVVDALLHAETLLDEGAEPELPQSPDPGRHLVLVTCHRRESFGEGLARVCAALATLAGRDDIRIIWPVHPNPRVIDQVRVALGGCANLQLVEPLGYLPCVALMREARLILSDSGGMQEEACALGRPLLLMRELTERSEALAAGNVRLVGTDPERIVARAAELLADDLARARMSRPSSCFGDGRASERIVADLLSRFAEPVAQAAAR